MREDHEEAPSTAPDAEDIAARVRAGVNRSKGRPVTATPFQWEDLSKMPPREWLFGDHAMRGYVSVTAAPGGTGKTNLSLGETLSLLCGIDFLSNKLCEPCKCWYLGLEDPMSEYKKRVLAAAKYYGIPRAIIESNLYMDSSDNQDFVIAREDKQTGIKFVEPIIDSMIANIMEKGIGFWVIDPLVSSHAINEVDNPKVQLVIEKFRHIARTWRETFVSYLK
jgi:RecA-family ATPase